jgi:hypothetical protein
MGLKVKLTHEEKLQKFINYNQLPTAQSNNVDLLYRKIKQFIKNSKVVDTELLANGKTVQLGVRFANNKVMNAHLRQDGSVTLLSHDFNSDKPYGVLLAESKYGILGIDMQRVMQDFLSTTEVQLTAYVSKHLSENTSTLEIFKKHKFGFKQDYAEGVNAGIYELRLRHMGDLSKRYEVLSAGSNAEIELAVYEKGGYDLQVFLWDSLAKESGKVVESIDLTVVDLLNENIPGPTLTGVSATTVKFEVDDTLRGKTGITYKLVNSTTGALVSSNPVVTSGVSTDTIEFTLSAGHGLSDIILEPVYSTATHVYNRNFTYSLETQFGY